MESGGAGGEVVSLRPKYPFIDLAVGQSVLWDLKTEGCSRDHAYRRVTTRAYQMARKHGMKFKTQVVGDFLKVTRIS